MAVTLKNLWAEQRANFLLPIVAAVPLGLLANSWTAETLVFKGQPLSVLIPLLACVLSVIMWIPHRRDSHFNTRARVFLLGLLFLWAWTFLLDHFRSTSVNYSTFVVPIVFALILAKKPSLREVTSALILLGWATIAVTLAHEVLTYIHGSNLETGATLINGLAWNRAVDMSWHGPFEYVSFAGIAGTFLILYGLTRTSLTRIVFVIFGALMVYEAGQLTPVLGILAGLVVLVVFIIVKKSQISHRTAALMIIAGEFVLFTCAIAIDPTLSGRTDIYLSYLQLWKSNVLIGVGHPGIVDAMRDGLVPSWIHDAHNIFIDSATKYGLVGLVILVVVLFTSVSLQWSDATKGRLTGLLIGVAFISMGMLESFGSWNYLTLPWIWLVLATLWCSSVTPTRTSSN